ncbi:MAG: efflux RND transporter periplasmic adaptor subunit [Candidatus Latescibacterota bacterium]|nr:MAG: efflux RND transporter periplasmic adaptor subunit [Candidatus Latescibacterota bacterium]
MTEKRLKIVLPFAILAVGAVVAVALIKSRSPVETRPAKDYAPLVRVVTVEPTDHQFKVTTHGTVKPRTETALVPEVAGRVVSIAPSFADGGFFEKGDVLVRLDSRDYELAVVSARGVVAQAKVRAELEEAQAEVAREEWKTLGGGKDSPLATRELQVQEALAALAAAEAALEKAQRDLDRTRIRAPFAGRVRQKMVDVGQYVSPGIAVAHIFAVDYVEVRLPIPDSDLAFLDLPVNYRGEHAQQTGLEVTLYADFAGDRHSWSGRIVRVEGEIDPVSRMVHAIAQVDDPYGRGEGEDPMPLAIGLFVDAEISGRVIKDAFVIPRSAMRDDDQIIVVDDDNRLRFRDVRVGRIGRENAVILGGLRAGDRVCVSLLEAMTDGMKVRTGSDAGAPPDTSATAAAETENER